MIKRRNFKSFIVDLIACTLSVILLAILIFAVIGIISLITLVIENANMGTIVVSTVGTLIAIFLELRKG